MAPLSRRSLRVSQSLASAPPHVLHKAGTIGASGATGASLIGHSKGIKQVLLERQLVDPTTKLKGACTAAGKAKRKAAMGEAGIGKGESVDVPKHAGWTGGTACCLEFLLSEQDDFKEQQNAIQELIVSRGHHCIFLPKYHPELNFIERYWSRVKWYARQHSDGTVAGLKATAAAAMKPVGGCCDLALIRRYARTSWRWVDAYRRGLDGVLASWAVRQSKCHRCVTDAADREVERLAAVQEKSAAERAGAAGVEAPPAVVGVLADAAALGLLECCDADS